MLQRPSGRGVAALAAAAFTILAGPGWAQGQATGGPPTVEEARAFVESAEQRLLDLSTKAGRAAWVQANFITDDTERIASDLNKDLIAAAMELAKAATRFDGLTLPPELARKMKLIKLAPLPLPAPSDPKLQTELAQTAAGLEAAYGKGKYCRGAAAGAPADESKDCLDVGAITRIMAESRKYDELLDVWTGWHTIAPPMRPKYTRLVELANQGARDLNFADLGAMWRSAYDMPPDAFAAELDRLWGQVRPLYEALHTHVRAQLVKTYGADKVPADGPIPAHLLGNIWAQEWGNIYPLVAPPGSGGPGYDLTALLKAKKVDEKEMVRYGERFFTSLGFDPLPKTFWERSLFVQPKDRDVVCHASAWDIDDDDYRIKMCIEVNAEDFVTIHHELGHNFYQRAYRRKQPLLFRNSANDGFHEAIGDAIALSVTPQYLVQVGLLDKAPGPEGDIQYLLRNAMDKIAFLPFRAPHRPVAMEGLLRRGHARRLQQGVVGAAPEVPGHRTRGAAERGVVRSRREVPRAGQRAVYALLPRPRPAVPVPPRVVPRGRLHRPAAPVLDLREQGRGGEAERDAGDGPEPAVAGGPGSDDGREADRRHRDPRLLQAADGVAGEGEQGTEGGLEVGRAPTRGGGGRSLLSGASIGAFTKPCPIAERGRKDSASLSGGARASSRRRPASRRPRLRGARTTTVASCESRGGGSPRASRGRRAARRRR